jgi:GH15 family glucan-1,4-alpha-glucosidase
VFAAVLDPERGGTTAICPAHRPFESLQRYDGDTNVLETLFKVEDQGLVRLLDYMPWTNDPRASIHEVHRRVECVEGDVELDVLFDPRFDYGAIPARLEIDDVGVLALGPRGERLVAVLGGDSRWTGRDPHGVGLRIRLRSGERRWMVISWDGVRPESIPHYRPSEHLRATRRSWRRWAAQLNYDGPWRHHVLRSALVLKTLIYAPTGAMVAAPTTSFPEWIGGGRNWDYRYVWTRDAAMAIRAENLLGYGLEAREFFYFMRDTFKHSDGLRIMYAVDGRPVPEEQVLSHLKGVHGSHPVRVGNGAKDQVQLDTAGALLDAAYLFERFGGRFPLQGWRRLRMVASSVQNSWRNADNGMWEPRCGLRHNVHSRLMCWVALHRGQKLARLFGDVAVRKEWLQEAGAIRGDLLANGLDPSGRWFVSSYEGKGMDANLLLIPITGFLDAKHPLVVRTTERIRGELGDGPFLYRYRMDDGLAGPEGAFTLCGFWLAEVLALAGRVDEAMEVFSAHAEASNHVGLLAEEIHPKTRAQLGNFPQAFSHLGLINAAFRIDLALRLRDEGVPRPPHLIDPDLSVE